MAGLQYRLIVNVSAMIGLLPLKGITLPFISAGGTSLIFAMMALGVVFLISRLYRNEEELNKFKQRKGRVMKLLITGGGTAGHITPLLAIAEEVKKRHPQAIIRYIGQRGDAMNQLVADNAYVEQCYKIFAGKWRRYNGIGFWQHAKDVKTFAKNLRDIIYLKVGFIQSLAIMIFWRPNIVFVKGGYVGLPVGLAAAILRIKIVTHDSDVVPGLTNRVLARFAKAIAVGMPLEVYKNFYSVQKTHFTGVPIQAGIFH